MPGKIQNYDNFGEKSGYHPPACTCYRCNEGRGVAGSGAGRHVRVRNLSPQPPDPARRSPASSPRPPIQPPLPPGAYSGAGQSRSRDEHNTAWKIVRRWILIVGVVAGVAAVALYFTGSGLFAPPEDIGPVAVPVPPPTEETPTETPLSSTSEPTAEPTSASASKPTATLEQTLRPAPTPVPLLVAYGGWELDCPGCPVLVLDTREPEVIGAASLQPGDTIRLAGCTRAQTTMPHRYIFEATDGNYSGVAVFGPEEHPGDLHDLTCFEMLGEYKETNQYAISVQYVDNRWKYELVHGEAAKEANAPDWEPAGILMRFNVREWVVISKSMYVSVVRARINPLYAASLAAVPTSTPMATSTPEPPPTLTPRPASTPRPVVIPVSTSTARPTTPAVTVTMNRIEPSPTPLVIVLPTVPRTDGNNDVGELDTAVIEDRVIAYINEERAQRGLNALEHFPAISHIARAHSQAMATAGLLSHNIGGKGPTDRALDAGYDCKTNSDDGSSYFQGVAENIAKRPVVRRWRGNPGSWRAIAYDKDEGAVAKGLHEQWMSSTRGHREVILESRYHRIGVGVAIVDEFSANIGMEQPVVYATVNLSRCR